MQYAEVGGEQNFMKLHDIRKANNPAAVEDWIREQEGGSASQGSTNTQQAAPGAPDPAPEVLSQDDIAALKANAYIHGAEWAAVTIIEYSDPGCGYCKRHNADGTINAVIEQFDGQVNAITKLNSNYVPDKTHAMLCAGEVGGTDAYYDYIDGIFQTDKDHVTIASDVGIDVGAFETCLDSGDVSALLAQTHGEFQKYNLGGTPGHIVLNNSTGEYTIISGAYPQGTFVSAVETLLQ